MVLWVFAFTKLKWLFLLLCLEADAEQAQPNPQSRRMTGYNARDLTENCSTGTENVGEEICGNCTFFCSLRHLRLLIVCCLNGSLIKWWQQFNKKNTSLLFASILGARLAPEDRLWPRWALLLWLWCGACASLHLHFNVCLKVMHSE